MTLFDFGTGVRKNVHKRVLFTFQDAAARFALEAGVRNSVASPRSSPALAHTALLQWSEIERNQPDCPGWYIYDYLAADA